MYDNSAIEPDNSRILGQREKFGGKTTVILYTKHNKDKRHNKLGHSSIC